MGIGRNVLGVNAVGGGRNDLLEALRRTQRPFRDDVALAVVVVPAQTGVDRLQVGRQPARGIDLLPAIGAIAQVAEPPCDVQALAVRDQRHDVRPGRRGRPQDLIGQGQVAGNGTARMRDERDLLEATLRGTADRLHDPRADVRGLGRVEQQHVHVAGPLGQCSIQRNDQRVPDLVARDDRHSRADRCVHHQEADDDAARVHRVPHDRRAGGRQRGRSARAQPSQDGADRRRLDACRPECLGDAPVLRGPPVPPGDADLDQGQLAAIQVDGALVNEIRRGGSVAAVPGGQHADQPARPCQERLALLLVPDPVHQDDREVIRRPALVGNVSLRLWLKRRAGDRHGRPSSLGPVGSRSAVDHALLNHGCPWGSGQRDELVEEVACDGGVDAVRLVARLAPDVAGHGERDDGVAEEVGPPLPVATLVSTDLARVHRSRSVGGEPQQGSSQRRAAA